VDFVILIGLKNILRYIGLPVSGSVAHFVWKMKQFEFHIFFTVRDITTTTTTTTTIFIRARKLPSVDINTRDK